MSTDLERRAEELLPEYRGTVIGDLIEQLAEQNAALNECLDEEVGLRQIAEGNEDAQTTIASLRQQLDRISAEREVYREALEELGRELEVPVMFPFAKCAEMVRRILAENDR